jgi:hypothetical protein
MIFSGDPKSIGVTLLARLYANNPSDENLRDMIENGLNGQIISIGPANIQVRRLLDARTRSAFIGAGIRPPESSAEAVSMLLDVHGAITSMAAHLKGIADVRSSNTALMTDLDMAFVRSAYWLGLDAGWTSPAAFAADTTLGPREKRFLPTFAVFRNYWNGR